MSGTSNKAMFRLMAEQFNEEKRYEFESLGNGGQYNGNQKNYAFELIGQSGIRATTKILNIPRRTLQRWCKRYGVFAFLSGDVHPGSMNGPKEGVKNVSFGVEKGTFKGVLC